MQHGKNRLAGRHARREHVEQLRQSQLPVVLLASFSDDRRADRIEVWRDDVGEFRAKVPVQKAGTPGDRIQPKWVENDLSRKQLFQALVGATLNFRSRKSLQNLDVQVVEPAQIFLGPEFLESNEIGAEFFNLRCAQESDVGKAGLAGGAIGFRAGRCSPRDEIRSQSGNTLPGGIGHVAVFQNDAAKSRGRRRRGAPGRERQREEQDEEFDSRHRSNFQGLSVSPVRAYRRGENAGALRRGSDASGEAPPPAMTRTSGWLLLFAVASLGLALFLWPALEAPVVLWSDSEADLAWSRAGVGVFRPVPLPAEGALGHQPKPGYLLFLRAAMRVFPGLGETRSVVVVQSLLLWGAITAASIWICLRASMGQGVAFAILAFSFLRLRDASSAVMPEALATALLIVLAAALAAPPRRPLAFAFLGLAAAVLFYVRPNCGAAAALMGIAGLLAARRGRALLFLAGGFAAVVAAFSLAARPVPPGDPYRGLGYQVLEASSEYYWTPSLGKWPAGTTPRETAIAEVERARENWRRTLAGWTADARREVLWRGLHGLFGTEFYDARWSDSYGSLSTASRLFSPFLLLAAITALLVAPPFREGNPARVMGWLLLAIIAGQNVLLGSNPRFVLPFLPALILLAIAATGASMLAGAWRRLTAAALFGVLAVLLSLERHVLDWQWGQIEAAGVRLEQRIPRGSLPSRGPATLHVRIAPPLPASGAGLEIFGPGQQRIYSSSEDRARARPLITVPIPDWLLAANREAPVELSLVSTGNYGPRDYLLFPVIPPPWSARARREGSPALSPVTGIADGALDWWAHRGAP